MILGFINTKIRKKRLKREKKENTEEKTVSKEGCSFNMVVFDLEFPYAYNNSDTVQ